MKKVLWFFTIIFLLFVAEMTLPSGSEQPETVPNTETRELIPQDNSDTIDELQVFYIDCGQADATLIKCKDNAMLIDSGENDQGTVIQMFLQRNGVKKLDYIIGTHLDSDHIGGMDVILTKFDCDTIILPDLDKDTAAFCDVIDTMNYRNYKNTKPVVGETYQLGNAEFTIISPNEDYPQDDHNNWSIGIKLEHGSNTFLFTGDAEKESEADILSNGIDISADVYKVAHHGSNTSTTDELLNAINPTFAVISCGKDNTYGHPHAETLEKLKARNIKVFRTDEQGTIVATSDGENLAWNYEPSDTWRAGSFIPVIETAVTQESQRPIEATDALSYVLNTSSKKFHYPTCNGLPTKNRKDTDMSREEIIAKGYVPCKRCTP